MTGGFGMPPGIGAQFGVNPIGINPVGINPAFGQVGMTPPGLGIQPGFSQGGLGQPIGAQQQFGTPQQQQQFAATVQHLAHQAATLSMLGQQVGGTLQQLAQYVTWQGAIGHQVATLLNHLAQQCAWQAAQNRYAGLGQPAIYGQPFGQTVGFSRPFW
ncbi:MAG: hypothetical protein AB7F22_10075 [Reyranella sp.]|uniref:hypothetical protein n=1 Tax=Reyranella sp. TaxID=1929291 RepID=UPI003D0BBA67